MDLKVFTLRMHPDRGELDDSGLDQYLQGRDVQSVFEHFLVFDGQPIWVVMVGTRRLVPTDSVGKAPHAHHGLCVAARRAARGKRRVPEVARFLMDLEPEVLQLQRELTVGTYQPRGYRTFEVFDPKRRTISAAPTSPASTSATSTSVLSIAMPGPCRG